MNIILISIDNLRYDCVGYQPFKKELEKYGVAHLLRTQTLDSIAEKGICFTQAITTTPYTTPAHASLLTGLYPPLHGVRVFWNQSMFKGVRTLPELLKQYNYKTILYTDSIHFKDSNSGIDRGFDFCFSLGTEKGFFDFLSEHKNQSLFILVHFFDVHAPYLYSETKIFDGYNNDFYIEMERLYKEYNLEDDFKSLREKPYDLSNNFFWKVFEMISRDEYFKLGLSLFIKGVNKFDSMRFNFFIERLKNFGIFEKSIVFILSDHGEGKSNRNNRFDHFGELYDSVIRIPLIIRHPDLDHQVIDQQVSIVDIFPTVLEGIANRKIEELIPYEVSGKNLLSENYQSSLAYSETWLPDSGVNLFDRTYYLRQRSIRTKGRKYVVQGKLEDIFDESIHDLDNKEFVRRIYGSIFGSKRQNESLDIYTSLLDKGEITKKDLLQFFLGLSNKLDESRYIIYDLSSDPLEEQPIYPERDSLLMLDFARYLSKIVALEKEGARMRDLNFHYLSTNNEALQCKQNITTDSVASKDILIKRLKPVSFSIPETLEDKEKLSMDIIKMATDSFTIDAMAATFTGGKDSTVLLHLIRRAFNGVVPFRVFNIDTSFKFKEVYEFRDKLARMWNLYLIVLKNEDALKLMNKPIDHEACCYSLKTTPLNKAIKKYNISALMTAIRWDEQEARSREEYFSHKNDHVRVQPILHFTERDIWDYIRKYNIPYCSLYDNGYRSLGCEPCTQPSVPGGTERSGRAQDKEAIMKRLREFGYF